MENEYYFTKISVFPHSGSTFHGRAAIFRKDNNEQVGSLNVRGNDKAHIEKRLQDKIVGYFNSLEPPVDFGKRNKINEIVCAFQRYIDTSTNIRLYLEDNLDDGSLNKENLKNALNDLVLLERSRSRDFFKKVNSLNEQEMRDLVSYSTDDAYENLKASGESFDDSRARVRLYDFIINPPKSVTVAHEQHCKRLGLHKNATHT